MDVLAHEKFQSNYLNAADLNGKPVTKTIANVEDELVGNKKSPVLHFLGKGKAFVLNKTNAKAIAGKFGTKTEAWEGENITLVVKDVDFQGVNACHSGEGRRQGFGEGRGSVLANPA